METRETIDILEERIAKMVDLYKSALAELESERRSAAALKLRIRELQQQAKADRETMAKLSLAVSMSGASGDTKAARAQVNRLLREVDECIKIAASGI